jgi:hydroxymethylglutaryl-CoA lyase
MPGAPVPKESPSKAVCITDVTLREYGQNVPASHLRRFSPQIRTQIAEDLINAGIRSLEVISCVNPGVAPAMATDALKEVASSLGRREGVRFITLVPNHAGYRTFLDLGLGPDGFHHVMGLFFSAIEAHNRANLGRSVKASLDEYTLIARDARSRNIPMNGYISAAFGYRDKEGGAVLRALPRRISEYMDRLLEMGVQAIVLSDLQGVADVDETRAFLERLLEERKGGEIGLLGYHPHNISGDHGVKNSLAVCELGIRRFDASLGGTGGCVTGAPGNQPTEGLVRAFHERGISTGIDERRLSTLSHQVGRDLYSLIPMTRQP